MFAPSSTIDGPGLRKGLRISQKQNEKGQAHAQNQTTGLAEEARQSVAPWRATARSATRKQSSRPLLTIYWFQPLCPIGNKGWNLRCRHHLHITNNNLFPCWCAGEPNLFPIRNVRARHKQHTGNESCHQGMIPTNIPPRQPWWNQSIRPYFASFALILQWARRIE